jgi:undecaprenyl-diphosphatase
MTVLDAPPSAHPRPALHHVAPPTSPSRLLCGPSAWIRSVGLAFVVLAAMAMLHHGSLLLRVDLPLERFVIAHRTPWLDDVVRRISFFGSTTAVIVGGLLLALAAWWRCRVVAGLVVAATVSRPLVEHLLKEIVGRPRPDLSRMVPGVGYSFPSGHVMASATLWLMVPVVLSLYHSSRRIWWASTIASLVAVGLISASRVYLGVHWFSDVVAGTLAAAVLLAALDLGFRWVHERRRCEGDRVAAHRRGARLEGADAE